MTTTNATVHPIHATPSFELPDGSTVRRCDAAAEIYDPGGRLVIPVERSRGRRGLFGFRPEQELLLVTKDTEGRITEHSVLPVAFVPLIEDKVGPCR